MEFVAVIYPPIFFALATIFFFLFVRKLFANYPPIKKNLIALIATLFFVFMPSLLHRTTAGVPEKEAGGIFFMFLTFYLFAYALQSKNKKTALIAGFLSGFATSLLVITWGGVVFVFLSIETAMLVYFFLRSIPKEVFFGYLGWILGLSLFSGFVPFMALRIGGIRGLVASAITGIAYFALFAMLIDMFITPRIYKKKKLKIPSLIFSFTLAFVVGFIFLLLVNPQAISYLINLKTQLLHPIGTDRITLTVAENNQPYFGTWKGTFTLQYFWLFIAGAIILFYEAVQGLKKNEKFTLTAVYAIFLTCLIFSRYNSTSKLNGTSLISQIIYFGGFAIFFLTFIAIYFSAYKSGEMQKFREVNRQIVLLLVMFFIAIISARGAIRLFFLVAPIATILGAFITVESIDRAIKSKGDITRIVYWAITILIIFFIVVPSFSTFSKSTINEATYSRPGYYEILWQKAMSWVRSNTPENAVFSHWWDYGYWVQTIGERATFLDGGNAYGYWDYQMGRHVLTGQNEQEALEVLKAHNVSYLLIDPTDIGKYPAYSSIGSDLDYDRYNWIPTFMLDEKQTQETRDEKIYWYQGGTLFDKEFVWYDKGSRQQFLLSAQSEDAVIAGVLLPTEELSVGNDTLIITEQPSAVVVYKRTTRLDIPMCYLYYNNKLYDYKEKGPCLKAAIYTMPKILQSGGSVSIIPNGASLYLNEKAVSALWVRLYLFNEGKNFELVHTEPNPILEQLSQQGAQLGDFAYFSDVLGPIKIWKANYPENITFKAEYLNTTYPDSRLTVPR
jgi:asparagine N-glycosylation enzyme membrane subunit Stt3